VSIPHFSLHTIQLIPTAVAAPDSGPINGALLVEALVLLTALSAAVYSQRRRVYSFLR
jgi:hypothetical protein